MDFLPKPRRVAYPQGQFSLDHRTSITLLNTRPSALLYAQMLQETILEETGLEVAILRGQPRAGEIVLREDGSLSLEQYALSVTAQGVEIRGGGDQALCHGVQTLRQWVQRHGARLPALQVEDEPEYPNRGYYLDVSRGRVPTLATLKEYADLLCRYKINQWQLYVEHTYLFRDFSEAWRDDTPLTAQEILELDAYCRARCIELVPSLSTFGHMYKILSTETYGGLRELEDAKRVPFSFANIMDHHTLNVSSEKALPFILAMISEYMELFISRKFNICADETFDLGKGRSRALALEQGEQALYMNHVKALCEWLVQKGRTPMFWGDIVWRYSEAYSLLPKETVCLNWGYSPDQKEDEVRILAQAGATQYVCPGVCAWNRWIPLLKDSFDNIRAMGGHGRKYGAIGLLNTDWGDFGHVCHPWFSVPGIAYGAAFAWCADQPDFEEMNRAVSRLAYGDASERFMEGFAALSCQQVFDWRRTVCWMEARDPERRKEIFARVDTARIPEANGAVAQALERLAEAARSMPPAKRGILHPLSVAAQGVRLWNEIALWLGQRLYGQAVAAKDGPALAAELEAWYLAYGKLWRAVSKEGGQGRILAMIMAYADLLRGGREGADFGEGAGQRVPFGAQLQV